MNILSRESGCIMNLDLEFDVSIGIVNGHTIISKSIIQPDFSD